MLILAVNTAYLCKQSAEHYLSRSIKSIYSLFEHKNRSKNILLNKVYSKHEKN